MEPLPGRERRHVWPRILTACLLLYSLLHALIAGVSDGAVSARYLDTAGVSNDDMFDAGALALACSRNSALRQEQHCRRPAGDS